METIKEIYDSSRQYRVVIFRREDGSFGFEDQHFSDYPREHCWIPHGLYSTSFCDTAEKAESEARGRVKWLSAESDI